MSASLVRCCELVAAPSLGSPLPARRPMTTNGCCAARSHLRTLSDGFERPTPLARLVFPLCGEKPTVSALPACSPLRTHLPRKKRLALFTPELYAAPPPFVNKLAPTNFPQFHIPPSDTKNAPPISPFASPPAAEQKPPQTNRRHPHREYLCVNISM